MNNSTSTAMSDATDSHTDSHSSADPELTEEFLAAEHRLFASERHGLRQLERLYSLITNPNLLRFLKTITTEPLMCRALIADAHDDSYIDRMERAARAALAHRETRTREQEALFVAALVARLQERILSCREVLGIEDLPDCQRRCESFLNAALIRLKTDDPVQARTVFNALGFVLLEQIDDLYSARLEQIVAYGWSQAPGKDDLEAAGNSSSAWIDIVIHSCDESGRCLMIF